MRPLGTILCAGLCSGAVLFLGCLPSHAFARPDPNPGYPVPHVQDSKLKESAQPYVRNYTEDMARSLGMRDGHWEVFDAGPANSLMPSLKGGLDSGGPMLRLQWWQ